MLELLKPDIVCDLRQLFQTHRSKIVPRFPTKRLVARVSITIRQSCASAFQTLDQSRDVVRRWELEEQMDVVAYDADLDDARAMTLGFTQKEAREEIRHRLIDERQSRPTSPGKVGVDANRHD